jgi:hypothetical protein
MIDHVNIKHNNAADNNGDIIKLEHQPNGNGLMMNSDDNAEDQVKIEPTSINNDDNHHPTTDYDSNNVKIETTEA